MHDEHSRFSSGSSNRLDGLFKKLEGWATIISLAHSSSHVSLSTPEILLSFLLVRLDSQAGRTL